MPPARVNNERTEITLRQFRLEWILPDSIVILVGRRRSGKSWLTRELMYNLAKRGMPYGKIYSGTEHANPFFRHFFPPLYIYPEVTDEDIKNILCTQKVKVRKCAKKLRKDDGRCIENNFLLVFDDMMSDDDVWKKSKHFKKLFVEGRHYNILFIFSIQTVLGILPAMRENTDFVFIFANEGQNLKKLYENYAGVVPTFDMFKKIFYNCTRDRGCMVIDKTNTSDNLEDKVFHYKAKDPGKFRFGSSAFWKLNDECYQSEDDEDDDDAKDRNNLCNMLNTYGNKKKYTISMTGK